MSAQVEAAEPNVDERIREAVNRAIERNIKGLQYLTSPDPPVGVSAKDLIYRRGTLELFHYRPLADEIYRVPLLLVMSLVSRSYIFDLSPGQSLVEYLLKQGYDVYMIDWGVPRPEDKRLRLEDYVLDFIPDCMEKVVADSGEPDITIVGYCMGGQLSVMYAALHPDGPLQNLACFTTPVDNSGDGVGAGGRRGTFDVDRLVDTLGNIPPDFIVRMFEMQRPVSRVIGQIRLWDNMWNDEFVHQYRIFDRWANDQIPFPGECFRQVTKELGRENKLFKNTLELNGRRVDLKKIKVPFLHVMAEHDHIAPFAAASPLSSLVGSEDKQDIVLKGGHVSLIAGPNAVHRMWPALDAWLAERSL
jgi:poly[(R)-3-hydroxyalkanoate] polymerase subunit PhaC